MYNYTLCTLNNEIGQFIQDSDWRSVAQYLSANNIFEMDTNDYSPPDLASSFNSDAYTTLFGEEQISQL
jgi:flagellar basal body rod protein FlgB